MLDGTRGASLLTGRRQPLHGTAGVFQDFTRDKTALRQAIGRVQSRYEPVEPGGTPYLSEYQAELIESGDPLALDLLDSARAPRTTVQTPYRWSEDAAWKRDFYKLDMTPEQLAKAREEMDGQKAVLAAKLAGD